jgi:asparagine synthase (glutamine-hydrolysing)
MCGICGFTLSIGQEEDRRIINTMKSYLQHRGPDDEGSYFSRQCILGHRRLSIIDLESGHQPMANEDRTVWIVFNGEIYNYKDLWSDLKSKGHRFSSNHSDSEVIVHGYEEWGIEVFRRLNGIFAIAIWDSKNNSLIMARDHIGVKPLYYTINKKRLIFASEPKAILSHTDVRVEFNPGQMAHYFFYRAPVHPETLFKNIYKVSPGSFAVWRPDKLGFKETVYWCPQLQRRNPCDEEEICNQVRKLVCDSVGLQLISDVPLGIFLSGGVDSSLVGSTMGFHNVSREGFVVSSGGPDDEANWSHQVASLLNIKNNVLNVGGEDFLENFDKWVYFNDDPVSDPSALALLLLSRFARNSGKIVMLSGEGGDELFGGYNSYLRFLVLDRLRKVPFSLSVFSRALRVCKRRSYREDDYSTLIGKDWGFLGTGHNCSFDLLYQNLSPELNPVGAILEVMERYRERAGEVFDKACLFDQRVRLPNDILARTDRASMAVSLEARVPLLDFRIIELANSIPQNLKFKRHCLKYILKKILLEYIPRNLIYRKKIGFYLPVAQWLRGELADVLNEYAKKCSIPYINYQRIRSLLSGFSQGRYTEHTGFIWSYLLLEHWYDSWCSSKLPEPKVIR